MPLFCEVMTLFQDLWAPSTSLYCERSSPDFWAEPLNALTSLLVIFVALAGFWVTWRRGTLSPSVAVLIGLAACIGLGSFLLHTYATVWSEIVDVLPIWVFVVVYGLLALRRFAPAHFNLPFAGLFGLVVLAGGVTLGAGDRVWEAPLAVTSGLSGSFQYFPATLMIASVSWFIWQARHPSLLYIGKGIALFALALVFRSLDMQLCDRIPTGTHFMWHIINCVVFWNLIGAYAAFGAVPRPDPRRRLAS